MRSRPGCVRLPVSTGGGCIVGYDLRCIVDFDLRSEGFYCEPVSFAERSKFRRPERPRRMVAALVFGVAMILVLGACGVNLGVDGARADWSTIDGQNGRKALVVSPEDHDPDLADKKLPLVVNLHGLNGTAEEMATMAEWPEAVVDHNLLMVFPEGVEKSWNAGGCCGEAETSGTDDVVFLDAVIKQMVSEYQADPEQVYMTGYSNGGMMTYRYNCERPDQLVGAASYAGTDYSDCTPDATVPFFQISGSEDTIVPPLGGQSAVPDVGNVPSVPSSIEGVAGGAGCQGETGEEDTGVVHVVADDCRDDVTVQYDLVNGLDHHYPTTASFPTYVAVWHIVDFWGLSNRPSAESS